MVDLNQSYLIQQQDLLREIRDELRTSRMSSGAPGSSPGGVPARPSSTFVQGQMVADKMLAGQWGSLGWTGAYRPYVESSFSTDFLAMMGLARAPTTLGQQEYQAFAGEFFGRRMATGVGSIFAPAFTRNTNTLADQLQQFSGRFLRAGDAGTGILGFGLDPTSSFRSARDIQMRALGDLRLSGQDYTDIVSTGLQSGQFDFSNGMQGFQQRLREMTEAFASLARVTNSTVQEIAQAAGSLRQAGIVDVADQSRLISQMSAAARVGGMTNAEMGGIVHSAIGTGLPLGIGATGSANIAMQTAMTVRQLSRSGVISPHVVAAGGGVQGITQSITGAAQRFLGSDAGLLAAVGGLGQGRDFFGAMSATLGATGGSMDAILGLQANRMDIMDQLTRDPTAANNMMVGYTQSMLSMMGIEDMRSQRASNMAFTLMRGQMGDAAALAFARSNFTAAGVLGRDQARLSAVEFEQFRDEQDIMDRAFVANSMLGRFQRGLRGIGRMVGEGISFGQDAVMGGAGSNMFGLGTSRVAMDLERGRRGLVTDVDNMTLMRALTGRTSGGNAIASTLAGSTSFSSGLALAGGTAGSIGGMVLGGALAGTFVGGPIGMVLGGIGGAAAGLFGGAMLDESNVELRGADILAYQGLYQNLTGSGDGDSRDRAARLLEGAVTGTKGSLLENSKFQSLILGKQDRRLGAEESHDLLKKVQDIASETGETTAVIGAALRQSGVQVEMVGDAPKIPGSEETLTGLLERVWGKGRYGEITETFNLADAGNLNALADYAQALSGGTGADAARAQVALASRGLTGESLEQLRIGLSSLGRREREMLPELIRGRAGEMGSSFVNRRMRAVSTLARDLVRGDAAASEQLEGILKEGGGHGLLRALIGQDSGTARLRQALADTGMSLFSEDIGLGSLASADELQSMSIDQLAQRYTGFSKKDLSSMREQMGEKFGGGFRQLLALRMLESRQEEVTGEQATDTRIASLLQQAGMVMDNLVSRLKLGQNATAEAK